MSRPISLTGIQPSGAPHLGNYLGAIRPALGLAQAHDAYYFIADEHALTTVRNPDGLRRQTYDVAATWLALGLDPERVTFYRQSDIGEVFELAWILSCVTAKGLLNRGHAYKDAVADNERSGRPADEGVSVGLFNYPALMAADILLFDADVVPVGPDNEQHLEIARDVAQAFNRAYGEVLRVPSALVEATKVVGLDGRMMHKSYGNVIPIFAPADEQRKLVMRIVTDSRRPDEPKDPSTCNVFAIYRHVAPPDRVQAMRAVYETGGVAYAEVKEELADLLDAELSEPRRRHEGLVADRASLDRLLARGAERARPHARATLDRVRRAVGLTAA